LGDFVKKKKCRWSPPNCLSIGKKPSDRPYPGDLLGNADFEFYLNIQIREGFWDQMVSQSRVASSPLWSCNEFIYKGLLPVPGWLQGTKEREGYIFFQL
jgi:hypothetical protein